MTFWSCEVIIKNITGSYWPLPVSLIGVCEVIISHYAMLSANVDNIVNNVSICRVELAWDRVELAWDRVVLQNVVHVAHDRTIVTVASWSDVRKAFLVMFYKLTVHTFFGSLPIVLTGHPVLLFQRLYIDFRTCGLFRTFNGWNLLNHWTQNHFLCTDC